MFLNRATFFGLTFFAVSVADAAAQASNDYLIGAQSVDSGGTRGRSTSYSLRGSAIGGFGVGADAILSNGTYTRKPGFVGQLYRLTAIQIQSDSQILDEGGSRQLELLGRADDNTFFMPVEPSLILWTIKNGPLTVDPGNGVVTAGNVYQDTLGTVFASANSLTAQFALTVRNVSNDDLDTYSSDGIDDQWQVQYFGEPPNPLAGPNVDADGSGQTNYFKFIAGLNPIDGSHFDVRIEPNVQSPNLMNVIFGPIVSGRAYTVQYQSSLATGTWQPLTNSQQFAQGLQAVVTDLSTVGSSKFYRVQVSKP